MALTRGVQATSTRQSCAAAVRVDGSTRQAPAWISSCSVRWQQTRAQYDSYGELAFCDYGLAIVDMSLPCVEDAVVFRPT